MPAGSISEAINTITREMSATLRGPLPTARGGAAGPAMAGTAGTAAAADGAASGLVKLTAVLTVLKNTVNVVTGEITAASKLAAAGAAEARGELSKALAYRAQTPGWFMRGLSSIPIVGGMAKAGHEALNLRAGIPEYIETAGILEQQRTGTVALLNQMRTQNVSLGLQSQFLTPATQAYQQRMLGLKAGPEATLADFQAQEKRLVENANRERTRYIESMRGAPASPWAGIAEKRAYEASQGTLALWQKDAPRRAELVTRIEQQKKLHGELWQKEFYAGMTPQAAGHWGAFGFETMPTKPPAADPAVNQLVLIHDVLEQINKKFPAGKGP